jgi:hypothetical protein
MSLDEEEEQLQREEDESDFDSSQTTSETYDILDEVVHVRDDILKSKGQN